MKHQRSAVLAACGTKNAAFSELPINLCICVSCVQNSLSTNQFESILRLIRLVIMFFTKLRVCRFFFFSVVIRSTRQVRCKIENWFDATYIFCLFICSVWAVCTCMYVYCVCILHMFLSLFDRFMATKEWAVHKCMKFKRIAWLTTCMQVL